MERIAKVGNDVSYATGLVCQGYMVKRHATVTRVDGSVCDLRVGHLDAFAVPFDPTGLTPHSWSWQGVDLLRPTGDRRKQNHAGYRKRVPKPSVLRFAGS